MERDEATKLTNDLRAHWPTSEMSRQEAESWIRVLMDLRFDIAVATAERLIKETVYFPKVAEFISTYRSLVPSVAGSERSRLGCRACDRGWIWDDDSTVRKCDPCHEGAPRQMRSGREIEPDLSPAEAGRRIDALRRGLTARRGPRVTKERAWELVGAVGSLWPDGPLDADTAARWVRGLCTMDATLVEGALADAVDAHETRPTFTEFSLRYNAQLSVRGVAVLRETVTPTGYADV